MSSASLRKGGGGGGGTIKFGLMMCVNRFLIIDIQYYFVISEKRNHGKPNKYYVPSFFFEKAGNDKI